MNPYASYIGDGDPMQQIAATPDQLRDALKKMTPQRSNEPWAPGKWSPREVLAHLADCEITFGFRLRQTLAEDHHILQPFDQERWAATYRAYDVETALAAFSALRAWNLQLIRSVVPGALTKPVTHPERGTMTFQTVLETMAGHDLNHLRQVQAAVG